MNYQQQQYTYTEPTTVGGSTFAFARQPSPPQQARSSTATSFDPYSNNSNIQNHNNNQNYNNSSNNNNNSFDYPPSVAPVYDATTSAGVAAFDLLDAPLLAAPVPGQIQVNNSSTALVVSSDQTLLTVDEEDYYDNNNNTETNNNLSSVTPELVAAQQRILDDIRRRQQVSQSDAALARGLSTPEALSQQRLYEAQQQYSSRALVVSNGAHYDSNATAPVVTPQKYQMKQSRPYKTAAGAAGGAVAGGLIMAPVFPLGMVLGGVAGGVATHKACKAGEKRVQCRYEQDSFQQGTSSSPLARYGHIGDESGLV